MRSIDTASDHMGLGAARTLLFWGLFLSCLVFLNDEASAQTTTITDYNQGWIASGIAHNPTNDNTIVGIFGGENYNDFYEFDLAGLTAGSILGGTLNLSGGTNQFLGTGTYNLYVSTIDPTQDPSGYAGLVAGDLIGTVSVPSSDGAATSVEVDLNAQGVIDINQAAGGDFIVGGSFSSTGGLDGTNEETLFSGSGSNLNTITLEVPEPPVSQLFLLGGAAGLFGRYRVLRRC